MSPSPRVSQVGHWSSNLQVLPLSQPICSNKLSYFTHLTIGDYKAKFSPWVIPNSKAKIFFLILWSGRQFLVRVGHVDIPAKQLTVNNKITLKEKLSTNQNILVTWQDFLTMKLAHKMSNRQLFVANCQLLKLTLLEWQEAHFTLSSQGRQSVAHLGSKVILFLLNYYSDTSKKFGMSRYLYQNAKCFTQN